VLDAHLLAERVYVCMAEVKSSLLSESSVSFEGIGDQRSSIYLIYAI
jgi:hypothetical protein